MIDLRNRLPKDPDPGECRHGSLQRLGIQRFPVEPFRYYLMTCRACGTTLTTATLRRCRETKTADAASDGEGARLLAS